VTAPPLVLESAELRVTVDPLIGGTITAIAHKRLGASILGSVPWTPVRAPLDPASVTEEPIWLTRYTGGWPLLFPNGGDACRFEGAFHGFHGEASITSWESQQDGASLRLSCRFQTVPVEMHRLLSVAGESLTISERLTMLGDRAIRVMWGHHPTFGGDLLAGPFEIGTNARRAQADNRYDPASNPLRPGAEGSWPFLEGKSGPFDLSHPCGTIAAGGCLKDFPAEAWASIHRLDGSVAARLSWDAEYFPHAWLWIELGGTSEPPWLGRGHVIGLEPNTTWPANGLAEAARCGGSLLVLAPGAEIETRLQLDVFKPDRA